MPAVPWAPHTAFPSRDGLSDPVTDLFFPSSHHKCFSSIWGLQDILQPLLPVDKIPKASPVSTVSTAQSLQPFKQNQGEARVFSESSWTHSCTFCTASDAASLHERETRFFHALGPSANACAAAKNTSPCCRLEQGEKGSEVPKGSGITQRRCPALLDAILILTSSHDSGWLQQSPAVVPPGRFLHTKTEGKSIETQRCL